MHRIRIEQNRRGTKKIWIDDELQQRVTGFQIIGGPMMPMTLKIQDYPKPDWPTRVIERNRELPIATLIITVSGAPTP